MVRPNINSNKTKFIDLFAGIGGFHLALHELGAECAYASEFDEAARKTYYENFKNTNKSLFELDLFKGDITKEENQQSIPFGADILCAGFPCQPFSQAGFKQGFNEARGTLFFEIAKIIKNKQPKAIFLENVRHLFKHDNGKTFQTILSILEKDLNYTVFYKIIKASDYGLPTNRPRLFIVGFRNDIIYKEKFKFPDPIPLKFTMSDIFKKKCNKEVGYTIRVGGRGSGINDRRNWDSYLVENEVIRITQNEAKIMMGFPKDFVFPVSEAQAMKQLGNSVAVNAVKMIAGEILKILNSNRYLGTNAAQPPNTVIYTRAPNQNDTNYAIGDFWIYVKNPVANDFDLYVLMGLPGGIADWDLLSSF